MDKNRLPDLRVIRHNTPLRIAVIYALFGASWILLSDKLMGALLSDRAALISVSIYKGWAFVALTAALLYLLIRRSYRLQQESVALIRDNEDKLRAITDTAADAIILIDDRMLVTYWNTAAERMFGYYSEEMTGNRIDPIVPERYRQAHNSGFGSFLAQAEGTPGFATHEVTALKKDGTELPVELAISRVKLQERWHAAGIVRDASQRKGLESQLRHAQKMEAIGTLTGGIAHDFNNILTAIIGFGTLARMGLHKDDIQAGYLDNILRSADRAADLTRSLLAFSRNQPMEPKQADLNDIVHGAEKLLTKVLREDIRFRTDLARVPLSVLADSGQIMQILMNLAMNAVDAMPDGGSVILGTSLSMLGDDFIRIHGYGRPGRYALLSFSDTGIGMDEGTRQRIFEPFFTTKGLGKGTGLGLSSVYGIVKQHGGFINCYSEPGRGTTFRIYLPIDEAEGARPFDEEFPAVGGDETILLAEDDVMVRELIGSMLRKFGYKVIEAVDGEDAVNRFRTGRSEIRLVILDVIMPKKNGRQVYEEMRGLEPGIKAIFTSGYPAEVFQKGDLPEEGFSFLSKPAAPHEILQKVREAMAK